jgi:hypothetical protein
VAFEVEDFDSVVETFRANGVKTIVEPFDTRLAE